jgi:hypothetical protein
MAATQALDRNQDKRQQLKNPMQQQQHQGCSVQPLPKRRSDIFFYLPYHPKDITSKTIHENYNKTCNSLDKMGENFQSMTNWEEGRLEISKLTITYFGGGGGANI